MAGRPKYDAPLHKKSKRIKVDIDPTYPHDPQREAHYHEICARGLELKSYKVDPDELKAKYGKPKPPSGLQWPYTGYPKEDEEVSKWSKERVIEEVQAIMDEHGIECLPSTKMIKERTQTLNVMIQKHCGGVGRLAEMMNVKTWQQAKIEEERAVKESHEVEEKVQKSEEMLRETAEKVQELKEKAQIEAKIERSIPEPVRPGENMRRHHENLLLRIISLKRDLELAEHHLDGFKFAAKIMGIEL